MKDDIESAWIPKTRATANTELGPGGGIQYFTRDPRSDKYESILRESEEQKNR